jgi:D-glycero-D-manno-heptose 1,7-bisphosphate phosphatase
MKINKKIVFFFDRDGVLNKDLGHAWKPTQFKLLPQTKKVLKFLSEHKIKNYVISNQSVIGRGMCSLSDVKKFNQMINQSLNVSKKVIKKFYLCPHHPTLGLGIYKKKCKCRKPENGLILKAIRENKLNKKYIVMIGDKKTDYLSAKKSKIYFEYRKQNFYKQIKSILERNVL